jgi:hypothetical protein
VVGKISGEIPGLFAIVDEDHPHPEKVRWAEAFRISIGRIDGRNWLLLDPDVWIWPTRAREDATDFLDKRRGNRYTGSIKSHPALGGLQHHHAGLGRYTGDGLVGFPLRRLSCSIVA